MTDAAAVTPDPNTLPSAGEVVYVPKALSRATDEKDRRHVLLHACERDGTVSVVYGSTADTQARYGAACVVVQPDGQGTNGFDQPTFLYPGLLTPLEEADVQPPQGTLHEVDLAALRLLLPAAIGADSGLHGERLPARSKRGRLVAFLPALKDQLSDPAHGVIITHGILLTPHHLSCESSAMQTLVPLLAGFEPNHPDELVIKSHEATRTWLTVLQAHQGGALALVPDTFHAKARQYQIAGGTVDDETLRRVEETLLTRCGAR